MYLPILCNSFTCFGQGIRVGRFASGSEFFIRVGQRLRVVVSDSVLGEEVVVARVLKDGAEFVIGTGSTHFLPRRFPRRLAPR